MGYSCLAYTLAGESDFRNFELHSISTLRYVRRFLLAKRFKHPPRRDLHPRTLRWTHFAEARFKGARTFPGVYFLDTLDIENKADYRGIC